MRHGRRTPRRAAIAALLSAVVLLAPAAARAATVQLDGSPLDVYADGLGALQVRFDPQDTNAGEFYGPSSNPAHAGLELRQGTTYVSLGSGRTAVSGPALARSGATATLTSVFDVTALQLRVTEVLTYTNGAQEVGVHYSIQNRAQAPISFSAGELSDLYAAGSDRGTGVLLPGPPRFVGGKSVSNTLAGLREVTPWSHFQESYYGLVFSNFETGGGLSDSVDASDQDNGVGAQWDVGNLAPGASKVIDVVWQFAGPTINTFADDDDGSCSPTSASDPGADCTLREALLYAAAGPEITVPAGRYVLDPQRGPLRSSSSRTVSGVGARTTIIDAGGAGTAQSQVLDVQGGTLDLSGVTITGGDNVQAPGGGISVAAGATLDLADSTVTGNRAVQFGGGIDDQGVLNVQRSTIAGNRVQDGGGGGLSVRADNASATLTNTTISGNSATTNGGGVYAAAPLGLVNVTVAGNSASAGGGLMREGGAATLALRNTIVGANTPDACAANAAGSLTSSGNIAADGTCGLTGAGDRSGLDPLLGALANNGGPTDTRAPRSGSAAIDAVGTAGCPATDQRGVSRPQGARCDVGAYELVPPPPPTRTPTPTPTQTPTPSPTPTPTPTPTPLPDPTYGKSFNALRSKGVVKIKLPGSGKYVTLTAGAQIPKGTLVDTTKGRVTLVSADKKGREQHAWFYEGIFKVAGQTKGRKPITRLALAGPKPQCSPPRARKSGAGTARRRRKSRHLWGNGKGRFRTSGQYSSATVRGTIWLTRDSCKGTLVKVRRGVVDVRDFTRRRTFEVKAGHSHLSRPPRRG